MADDSQRTIPATPRRRQAARAEGLMPTAAPLAWAAAALVTVALLPTWARATLPAATAMLRRSLTATAVAPRRGGTLDAVGVEGVAALLVPALGLALAAAAAGLAVRLVCDGFVWQPARLAPRWARVSPWAGLARIASGRTLTAVLGAALGLAVLSAAAAAAAAPLVRAVGIATLDTRAPALHAAWRMLVGLALAAALVAIAQYAISRWRFERRIRMTPEEFAEEARALQADPKVRLLQHARRRG